MHSWLSRYIEAQHRALDSIPLEAVERVVATVRRAWEEDRQIFVVGNGGNAASASHFATDLGKGASDALGRRFRVITLADNVAWLTAIGNDYRFEDVFLRPLENYARPGDVLIASSVSGNSPNLVRAMEWARDMDLRTIAFVGAKKGGLAALAEQTIVVADTHYGRVEDVQMTLYHLICYAFMETEKETA
ncbi:SIS domain-containing protein [Planctomyces sp. SH-PL62]|uniref:D-sedoheptulose-7-phosphate isomerase n=1 Tax=Planctomyces sp. SH-PL62 TaxID=1636152 RepID=UPI00078C8394|nr:SIS domain-containing protein [Planctomyces sp. SH-PL62]AMV38656.1 Phosphoheptose isomerase 1 [Planctomyces sp. SH-PL62]